MPNIQETIDNVEGIRRNLENGGKWIKPGHILKEDYRNGRVDDESNCVEGHFRPFSGRQTQNRLDKLSEQVRELSQPSFDHDAWK